ncbi:amidohydrolase [Candidatus Bathyarchaeota archaeon]|nr:amidohydrolase [Candidatus Bathyarchaeota archaeon]
MIHADLALINGKIVTMDKSHTIAQAVATKWGRILAVGTDGDIKEHIGAETHVIDLLGRTVIPGMIDTHCHMVATGISNTTDVDLGEEAGVRSIADLKKRIAEKAIQAKPGEWVAGVREDDQKLAEKRHPDRFDLDQAAPDNPVIVSTVGGHYYIANTQALRKAGITRETPDPVGGVIERDKQGEPTGGLHEKALELVTAAKARAKEGASSDDAREEAIEGVKRILQSNASTGLTCVYDMVDGVQLRTVLDLKNRGSLPIRVRMDVEIALQPELDILGITQGLGDEFARICGLKFFFDGAVSARTAAVAEAYNDRPGYMGVLSTTREIAHKTILEAVRRGHRVSAHANGERAITMYLDIIAEAQAKYPRPDSRNRVIHCSVLTPDLVNRIRKLGLLPTIFGPYPYYHGDKLIPAFGPERLERMFAARWLLDAGIKVAAHSDHDASPYPPLMAIHALVNRRTRTGKPLGQSQRISVTEALSLYTSNAAYHSFDENDLGSIESGKLADMVILGIDLLTAPSETIKDIPVDATIMGGRITHERTGQQSL